MGISLHHAQVFYPPGEEARARKFYGEALGLAELERPSTLRDRAGIWYAAPPGHVHLSADRELGLHPRRHFALRVADLDATVARLRAAGARFEEADPIPGWRRTYVMDPFGNKIELDEIPERACASRPARTAQRRSHGDRSVRRRSRKRRSPTSRCSWRSARSGATGVM